MVAALASAGAEDCLLKRFRFEEPAMGTIFRAEVYALDEGRAQHAVQAAWIEVHRLNAIFSDYDPESELMRLCRAKPGSKVQLSPDLYRILQLSGEISRSSGGAFDVTIGPLKRLWRQSRRDAVMPSAARIQEARAVTGGDKIQLFPDGSATLEVDGMRLDLGGIAKGYAADAVLAILKSHGLDRSLVAASGDVLAGESPPGKEGWEVGIASLDDPDGLNASILLRNQALSTSGDTQQAAEIAGVTYSHILDPKTGIGLSIRRMVNVLAPSSVAADAWATALSVAGTEGCSLPKEIAFRFEEASPDGNENQRERRRNWPSAKE